MKTQTRQLNRATAFAVVAFATLLFTTAPATTRETWQQRIEADWPLAKEVPVQDQLSGLVTRQAGADGWLPAGLRRPGACLCGARPHTRAEHQS
jgi:hypothetical protein